MDLQYLLLHSLSYVPKQSTGCTILWISLEGVWLTCKIHMQVLYHYFTTTVVSMMHGMIKPGVEESSYFWLLKAAAQQMALRINHAEEVSVLDADQFLVTGEVIPSCAMTVQFSLVDLCLPISASFHDKGLISGIGDRTGSRAVWEDLGQPHISRLCTVVCELSFLWPPITSPDMPST